MASSPATLAIMENLVGFGCFHESMDQEPLPQEIEISFKKVQSAQAVYFWLAWIFFQVHVPDGAPPLVGVCVCLINSTSSQKMSCIISIPLGFGTSPGFSL